MLGSTTKKAQSAMEYLMTYGWAILIMAVVLGALFYLGVFNSGNATGSSCLASAGYLCQNPLLSTNGMLSLQFGQDVGQNIYNVELACASLAGTIGPSNTIVFSTIYSNNGVANPETDTANVYNSLSMLDGDQLSITQLPCYGTNGAPIGNTMLGSSYSGYLWINFTTTQCTARSPTCSWVSVKAVKLTVTAK
jgi:hypothetical protein